MASTIPSGRNVWKEDTWNPVSCSLAAIEMKKMPERKIYISTGRFHDPPVEWNTSKAGSTVCLCLSFTHIPFRNFFFISRERREYGECLFHISQSQHINTFHKVLSSLYKRSIYWLERSQDRKTFTPFLFLQNSHFSIYPGYSENHAQSCDQKIVYYLPSTDGMMIMGVASTSRCPGIKNRASVLSDGLGQVTSLGFCP